MVTLATQVSVSVSAINVTKHAIKNPREYNRMNNKEISSSNQGPADPMERFEKLLHSWCSNDIELAECNDLRIAFQLGREQGHLENQAGDYENPKP